MTEVIKPRPEKAVVPELPTSIRQTVTKKVIPLIASWETVLKPSQNMFMHGHQAGLKRSVDELGQLREMLTSLVKRPKAQELGRLETEDGDVKVMLRLRMPTEALPEEELGTLDEHERRRVERDLRPTPSPNFLVFWANPTFADKSGKSFPGRPKLAIFTEIIVEGPMEAIKGQRLPQYGILLAQGSEGIEGRGVTFVGDKAHTSDDKIESNISVEELDLLIGFVKEMWRLQ